MVINQQGKYQEWDCIYRKETTTQRMELAALHLTLCRIFEEPDSFAPLVSIGCDSPYVRRGLTDWVHRWEPKDWKKAGGDRVIANLDLWQNIYYLTRVKELPEISWDWGKGVGTDTALSNCHRVIKEGRVFVSPIAPLRPVKLPTKPLVGGPRLR